MFTLISIRSVAKLKICPIYPRNMFALYRPGIAADRLELREVARMKTPSRETAAKFEDARAAEAAKTARLRAQIDPHSPGPDRVNGVVQNMPEFQQAFACRVGQPMVRQPACRVW